MSGKDEFLPRVIIESNEYGGSFRMNFKLVGPGRDTVPEGAKEVLESFEDWTAFCIASIKHMPPMSGFGYHITDYQIKEEVLAYLKDNAISSEETPVNAEGNKNNGVRHSFIIHDDDVAAVAQKMATTSHLLKAASSIQRANLSALIAEFDFLLLRLLRSVCLDFPELLIPGDETISVGYLRSGKSVQDWEADQVEKVLSKKLRGSHKDLIDWILSDIAKLNDLSYVKKDSHYRDFLEVCQRRHLFIHAGGVVNKEYLENCISAGIPKDSLPKLGTQLDIDHEYLRSAAARVYVVGSYILHLVFQQVYRAHASKSYSALLSASHEFLLAELTKMAARIVEFAEFNKAKFDNDLRLKFGINKALTKLFEPGVEEEAQSRNAELELARYDWSVTDPVLALALACVKRDFENLLELAQSAHTAGLSHKDAKAFAVFREARETEGFMECFPKSSLLITDESLSVSSSTET
ncbi:MULTISPECIES: hypothetical protein [unclassified Sulfitobacter]|uniref:hypothetical protein n=1 Tax=unclassified Sulfitobacter TaxID=196795 RepID=UPI0004E454A6|nr:MULTISPECIES: hypothetical protein [unclassified Sulfitobacter]PTA98889.1 hypothetical protein C8254_10485 [Sulfitobacter sp. CB-A]ULO18993.1 hypothetical protein IV89_001984 [Sulfitobacter sp. CB2047]